MFSENAVAARVYSDSTTQWVYGGHGIATGLNYAGVREVMAMLGVENTADTFQRIQILERETLSIHQDRRDRNK